MFNPIQIARRLSFEFVTPVRESDPNKVVDTAKGAQVKTDHKVEAAIPSGQTGQEDRRGKPDGTGLLVDRTL